MLDSLRSAKSNFILQVVIALIVLSFVFWIGISGMGTGEVVEIASVNGERITDTQLNIAFRNQAENYRRMTGQSLPTELQATVREQVRDDLVTRALIRQEGERLGLLVSDRELAKYIGEMPGLRDETGKFQRELYESYVSRYPTFERDQREALLIQKTQRLVADSVSVSEAEVKGRFLAEADQIDLEFVRISNLAFERGAQISEDDVQAAIAARADEISKVYDRDKARKYDLPRKAKARHILKKFDEGDQAAETTARQAIDALLAQAKQSSTVDAFGELATINSDDTVSAARGGDLGYFDEKRMDPAFSAATFAMQPGQISEVVKSRFGYHIIFLESFQEPKVIALSDAQAEIARDLLKKEAGETAAKAFAERVSATWTSGGDLTALLAEQGLSVQESGLFARSEGRIPRLGAGGDALDTAFSLTTAAPVAAQPLSVPGGLAVLKLKERKGPDMQRYEEEKATLRAQFESEKKRAVVQAWIDGLKADAKLIIIPLA